MRKRSDTASPERAALAERVHELRTLAAERAAAEAAQTPAAEAVWDLEAAVEAAKEAITAAELAGGAYLRDMQLGTAGEPPETRQAAVAKLAAAEAELAAARARRAALEPLVTAGEQRRNIVELMAKDARRSVVRIEAEAHAHRVAARIIELQRELIGLGAEFAWLVDAGVFPAHPHYAGYYHRPADEAEKQAYDRLFTPPANWVFGPGEHDGAAPWRLAFEALLKDATAVLPVEEKQ